MLLCELQQRMSLDLFVPLHEKTPLADTYIKSTPGLSAHERIEIYRCSYWHRLIDALRDDFPGLQALLGETLFDEVAKSYLKDYPSRSFTLRNLGQFFEFWFSHNKEVAQNKHAICLDMVRLEWAEVEAFDNAALTPLSIEHLASAGSDSRFTLQPHLRLLALSYPVDEVRLATKKDAQHLHQMVSEARRYEGGTIHLAVYRHKHTVYFLRLSKEQWLILMRLSESSTLEEAIDDAFRNSTITPSEQAKILTDSFNRWSQLEFFGLEEDEHARNN